MPSTLITTRQNGKVLLDGSATDLSDYSFGPSFFEEPVLYNEPLFRYVDGNGVPVNAIGAAWSHGIGSVIRPLPAGDHILIRQYASPILGITEKTDVYRITDSDRK